MVTALAIASWDLGSGLYLIGRPIARIYAGHALARRDGIECKSMILLSNDYIMEIMIYADEGAADAAITSGKLLSTVLMNACWGI